MPPIEVGPTRAIGAIGAALTRQRGEAVAGNGQPSVNAAAAQAAARPALRREGGVALDAGSAPIDTDRVSQVRKAVEEGSYPLIPTRIADAMIAAGVMLRSARSS